MVIPVGGNIADFNGIITLNDTAGFLWGRLKAGAEPASLVDALLGEYEVSRGEAERDVEEFLALLREHKVLQDE